MARKTNKTDHVLNLLSSGKKSGKEENDAPPVDLRRKLPEPESDDPFETHLPEPKMTAQEEDEELPEPRKSLREEDTELPEPRMSTREEVSELPEPRVSEDVPMEGKPTVVTVAAAAPSVSVVHASNGENSIAEAVKDSLEAEFNEYLREKEELEEKLDEKLEEIVAQQEQAIEWKPSEPKEPAGINVFELLGGDEEMEEHKPAEEPKEEPVEEPKPVAEAELEQIDEVLPMEESEPFEEPKLIEEPIEQIEIAAESEPVEEAESFEEPERIVECEPVVESEPDQEVEAIHEVPAEEPEPLEETQEETKSVLPAAEEQPSQQEAVQEKEEYMPQSKNEEKNYVTINVMEHLVRDQVPTYVKQFGHCDCDRCIEDTVALTLTHLPSKYVVVNKDAVSPLLNFYEKKYAGQLIVEITKATMIVNGAPHH